MKLRVLLFSIFLAFGMFFSSISVAPAQAQIKLPKFQPFQRIKEMVELLGAQQREKNNASDLSHDTVVYNGTVKTQATFLKQIASPDSGAIADTGKMIGMIYQNAPASGERYVADLLYNMKIGPAQPAYAQVGGLGFAALEPILQAWKQFRNIAYLFFIIITLVIGFMIMMRQKVGSQAAVTAQQAIPQVIIALITVTFSYAIAGFMIDLMYVMMYLMIGLFPDETSGNPITKNLIQIGFEMFAGGIGTAFDAVTVFVNTQVGQGDDGIVGMISGLTFALIIAFAYLFAMINLFFELLKTYIAVVISIILSPLLLMMGALPGRNDVFMGWIKGIGANLIAYPVFLLLIILHKLMTYGPAAGGGFLPPFLMGRGNPNAISSLVGLAIMLIAKDLVQQAKKSVNPKGSGIFEQFGAAFSSAVSKGWSGGQLIDGVGLSTIPGPKQIGKAAFNKGIKPGAAYIRDSITHGGVKHIVPQKIPTQTPSVTPRKTSSNVKGGAVGPTIKGPTNQRPPINRI